MEKPRRSSRTWGAVVLGSSQRGRELPPRCGRSSTCDRFRSPVRRLPPWCWFLSSGQELRRRRCRPGLRAAARQPRARSRTLTTRPRATPRSTPARQPRARLGRHHADRNRDDHASSTTLDTDTVRLDLIHALRVSKVTLDGTSIGYTHQGFGLVMSTGPLGEARSTRWSSSYAGIPHTVKAPTHRGDFGEGLGWTLDQDGNVYTFQEPYGAYSWYPVNDHPSDKATYDAADHRPAWRRRDLQRPARRPSSRRSHTFDLARLSAPVASYLTTIAIGPYTAYHDTMSDGTKATYWLLPRDEAILRQPEGAVGRRLRLADRARRALPVQARSAPWSPAATARWRPRRW